MPSSATDPQASMAVPRDERTLLVLLWLPVALSSTLLVLFLVVLHSQQQQGARITDLQQRLQLLEQTRAMERTTMLEQQLRAMLSRLQNLETGEGRLQQLERQLQSLEEMRRSRPEPQPRPRSLVEERAGRLPPALPRQPLEPPLPDPLLSPLPEQP